MLCLGGAEFGAREPRVLAAFVLLREVLPERATREAVDAEGDGTAVVGHADAGQIGEATPHELDAAERPHPDRLTRRSDAWRSASSTDRNRECQKSLHPSQEQEPPH